MKFILTRHATTDWNLAGRIQGHTDISLNQQGRIEAEELAKVLSGLGIHLIVSSDLKRASETGDIISASLSVPSQLDTRLRECSSGDVEGLTKEQAVEKYGPSMESTWDDQYRAYDFRPFGGEHRDAVLARHMQALETLTSEQPNKTLLLIGHGRGMRTLLAGLGHSPDLKRGEYRIIEYTHRKLGQA